MVRDSPARVLTHTDAERLSAVRRYHILDAPADGSFDSVARVAAQVFDTPIATVTIVDVDRVWFAACHGLQGVTQIGTEPGLCVSAVLQDGVYVVNDGAVDPRTLDHRWCAETWVCASTPPRRSPPATATGWGRSTSSTATPAS